MAFNSVFPHGTSLALNDRRGRHGGAELSPVGGSGTKESLQWSWVLALPAVGAGCACLHLHLEQPKSFLIWTDLSTGAKICTVGQKPKRRVF